MLTNIIATVLLLAVLGGAIAYIIKAKKSGAACIGCPHAKKCGGKHCQSKCNCEPNKKQ